jgi:hypothetical protein
MAERFTDVIHMCNRQSEPQRLLLLFASTQGTTKKSGKGRGLISPTMVVDKLPDEIADFSALVKEADRISKDWDFLFIAALSGCNGQAPRTEEAEPYLNQMTNDIASGHNIERYLVFDRHENPIELLAR